MLSLACRLSGVNTLSEQMLIISAGCCRQHILTYTITCNRFEMTIHFPHRWFCIWLPNTQYTGVEVRLDGHWSKIVTIDSSAIKENIPRNMHSVYILRKFSWWRHQMETFSALLALCAGNLRGIHRPRWIPRTKASDGELWCFLWSAPE